MAARTGFSKAGFSAMNKAIARWLPLHPVGAAGLAALPAARLRGKGERGVEFAILELGFWI
jgi:hypothetical protein